MTRDIRERLSLFAGVPVLTQRIALNWDQIEQYSPPPNPAKLTDSRVEGYIALYGMDSWELDALEPQVLADLIEDTVLQMRDEELWDDAVNHENKDKERLRRMLRQN